MTRVIAFLLVSGFVAIVSLIGTRLASLQSQDSDKREPVRTTTIGSTVDQVGEPGHEQLVDVKVSQSFVYGVDDVQDGSDGADAADLLLDVEAGTQSGQWPTRTIYSQDSGNLFRNRFAVRTAQNDETSKAFHALKNAESDEDKREAQKELRDALEDEYESSLEVYEESLKSLADKLRRLEEELDRRRSAKEELVDLRLKTLVNQAQGLGWPGQTDLPGAEPAFFYRVQPNINKKSGVNLRSNNQSLRRDVGR